MGVVPLEVKKRLPLSSHPPSTTSTQCRGLPRIELNSLIRIILLINLIILPILAGMKCLDDCPSVAARNCQISSLYETSQVSAVGLCQQPNVSRLGKSLVSQLMSEDFGMSIFPSALNLDRVFLTVDRDTQEVPTVCIMEVIMQG